ncbi:MAG: Molybdopterin synthase catalytic subunit [Candidatus Bathyarchaeota archaeon B26-2]|nr:MAG: Molybdopterin synthase catalytic subunit [Candidatus Bathyarchaeota archaeon B26-2]
MALLKGKEGIGASIKRSGIHEKGEISLRQILSSVRSNPDFYKAGAIGVFVGVVRGEAPDGSRVERLELEAYEEEAEKALETICRDLMGREGVVDVRIHHLVGEFKVGEDLVYVVVAGSHRDEVFSSLREAVERYKREALIFKREFTVDEKGVRRSFWVGEGTRIAADDVEDSSRDA